LVETIVRKAEQAFFQLDKKMGLYDDNLKDKIMEDIIPDSVTEDKCHMVEKGSTHIFRQVLH
jgi:hypothetical protein